MNNGEEMDGLRIDKWLWAARFFKTRSLAIQAVEGGHVRLNEERIKPSKEIRVGDQVSVRVGEQEWILTVQALSDRRGPASVARTLYEESQESVARRELQAAERRLLVDPGAGMQGRPTKKAGRQIRRFRDAD